MATATKTKPTKPTNTIDALRAEANAKWRGWALALARGGSLPPTPDLLEAAGLLGRDIDALATDAAYLRAVEAEEATRNRWQAALDQIEAERGPVEVIRKRIEQLESEITELRQREGWGTLEAFSLGTAISKVERLRKQRPDLFGDEA